MEISQYKAYDKEKEEIVSLVNLTNTEWFEFIKKLFSLKIDRNEIEQIDINYCAPLCNKLFVNEYDINTKYVSITSGEIGLFSLRLWLGENGIRSTLININESLNNQSFIDWWQKISLEPQIIEDIILTKKTQEYGINHIQLWLKSLNKEKPISAIDKFTREIKLWVEAHELIMNWEDHGFWQR